MKSIVIGVSGKIGAGKDTIADYLVTKYGFQIVRFSDALKEEVLKILSLTCKEIWNVYNPMFGIGYTGHQRMRHEIGHPTDDELRKMLWEDKPPIIRRLLQEWGTDLRRNEEPSYWTRKWSEKVYGLQEQGISVVTPDVRFWNEITTVQDTAGWLVRVHRPGTVEGDHLSEHEWTGFDGWDSIFINNGTKEVLYSQVEAFYKERQRLAAH